jgi:hypothetical protein
MVIFDLKFRFGMKEGVITLACYWYPPRVHYWCEATGYQYVNGFKFWSLIGNWPGQGTEVRSDQSITWKEQSQQPSK